MEYYLAIKINDLLIHTATSVNFIMFMLTEISHAKMRTYSMTAFMQNFRNTN